MKNQNKQRKQEEDLVDLPQEVPESTWKQFILTPKFLILVALALFFLGRNIYYQYNRPASEQTKKTQKTQQKQAQMSEQLYSRFFWYIILTVVFFIIFILLKRSNDQAQQQRIREQVRKQQEQVEKKKKIEQKANRIITSMDQFGNVIDEDALRKYTKNKQENTKNKQENTKNKQEDTKNKEEEQSKKDK